jgi:integrase
MKGCRPFTDDEVNLIVKSFSGRYAARDKALFLTGVKSEFRISELLSLTVGDVYEHGRIGDRVTVQRRHMKKKMEGRTVVLHHEAKDAIGTWLAILVRYLGVDKPRDMAPDTPLFCSRVRRQDGSRRPIARETAWRILEAAVTANELTGKIGTHSMCKTFANKVYEQLNGRLERVQKALGHKNINSTVTYLSFREEDIDAAILAA